VLYTGRTIGAALRALIDFGTDAHDPAGLCLSIAVIANFPIEANFIGKKIATKDNEVVEVRLTEIDGEDAIFVMENS
jgi:pyrimidine operon attenuation protein/uracil phosphoribosyltransferase